MANEEHLKILKQGVEAWNEWRKKNPRRTPDLTGANLTGANLIEANLNRADLTGANLYKADLNRAQVTAKQLITTMNWQEAILDSSLRVEAEKLSGAEK